MWVRLVANLYKYWRGVMPNQIPILMRNLRKYTRGYYPKGDDELSLVYINDIKLDYLNNDYSGKNPSNSMNILNGLLTTPFSNIGPRNEEQIMNYLVNNIKKNKLWWSESQLVDTKKQGLHMKTPLH